ncbi:hypothetical protein JS530_03085 [Bifidobacterium sp. LC6]|uniref:Uncharacterized protein n=1 Tax=Bifidobacterium colobi TaxID=2809026 RepID=A0ABS5UTX1_9BIFI|nr:hypothetical protein [Bifidobacterium colobi]MBT1174502.1 hypothetical protein [Bifidobacterium colobi]
MVLLLFLRFVLVGRLADGSQVFWDSLEGRPWKRVLRVRAVAGWTRAALVSGTVAAGLVPVLTRVVRDVVGLFVPEGASSGGGEVVLLGFLRPDGVYVDEWNMDVCLAVMWLSGFLLYWCFCRLVFGRMREYVPASLEELAFASSMRSSELRYMFGGPIVGTMFLLGMLSLLVMPTWGYWSDGVNLAYSSSIEDRMLSERMNSIGLVWMILVWCSPLLLGLRFVGPWDWRGRFDLHGADERRGWLR